MSNDLTNYLSGGYVIEVTSERTSDTDRVVVARYQKMPGCIAHGTNEEEAVAKLEAMRRAYIKARLERGADVPEPDFEASTFSSVMEHRSQSVSEHGEELTPPSAGFRLRKFA